MRRRSVAVPMALLFGKTGKTLMLVLTVLTFGSALKL